MFTINTRKQPDPPMCITYVDDIAQSMRSASFKHALKATVSACISLHEGCRKYKLRISSTKTCIVANSPVLAKTVANNLQRFGIKVQVKNHTKDLGTDAPSGARRATNVLNKRINKAAASSYKIKSRYQ